MEVQSCGKMPGSHLENCACQQGSPAVHHFHLWNPVVVTFILSLFKYHPILYFTTQKQRFSSLSLGWFYCLESGLQVIEDFGRRFVSHSLVLKNCFPFLLKMGGFGVKTSAKAVLSMALMYMWAWGGQGIGLGRKLGGLVEESVVLKYHNGPLLTSSDALDLHIIWYGKFSAVQRSIVGDFVESLGANANVKQPSVSEWWRTTENYRSSSDKKNGEVLRVRLGKQVVDETYSFGKSLKRSAIGNLVEGSVKSKALPLASNRNESAAAVVYLVLTSSDVMVERFCTSSCGFHDKAVVEGVEVPYAWVGNAETACPGQCAWPFHQPIYGPQTAALVAPNGDVGIDGMIINVATVLAGTVTNPLNSGYFQGDAAAPLEAVSACGGLYGKGAYPGYPGQLLVDASSGSSFNAHGIRSRTFLLPAMWDPLTSSCKTLV